MSMQAPHPPKAPFDAAVRQQALDVQRSFLVQAPAGSGKTELLTDRLLALLARVDSPEQILAITFTRKAAAEMHARVLHKLAAGQQPEPDAAAAPHAHASWRLAQQALQRDARLGWHLLDHPARLNICTIDAFCSRLANTMPWLSALGGTTSMTDAAHAHYQAAAQATLGMVDDEPAVARLLAHLDVDLNVACQLLVRMLECRDQWLPLLPGHDSGHDMAALVDSLNAVIAQDLHALQAQMPPGWAQQIGAALTHAAQTLHAAGDARLDSLLDGVPRPDLADDFPLALDGPISSPCPSPQTHPLNAWQAVAHLLLTQKNTLRKKLTITEGFAPKSPFKTVLAQWLAAHDDTEPWVAALGDVRLLPAQGYTPAQRETLQDLVRVLHVAAAQLALQFSAAGELDFIEVTQRALHALGDEDHPTDLLLSLDNALAHILVDEFQDTSFTQIRLLERLTAGWTAHDGRTLFLVGDPMQSIYRFRKAEVGWFLRVRQSGLGQVAVTPLTLTDNFRSRAGVVDWVNQTFAPLFPERDQAQLGGIAYAPSRAFHPPLNEASVHLHPLFVLPEERQSEDEKKAVQQRSEAAVLACVKEALQRHRDTQASDSKTSHPVAILVRARHHLGQVVRTLRRHGIACQAVDLEPLAHQACVQDMLQLIRALSHPADRLAWLSVLRSPLCGLRLRSLHALFGDCADSTGSPALTIPEQMRQWLRSHPAGPDARPGLEVDDLEADELEADALEADEARRLRHAAAALLDNSNASGLLPFAARVQQVWRQLGGERVYARADECADIEQLLRLLETLMPYGSLTTSTDSGMAMDMDELERRVEKLYAAAHGETPGTGVQVMTIHKSKGLQFETVILMGLHHAARSDTAPLLAFEQTEEHVLMGPIAARTADAPDPLSRYLMEREKKRAAFEVDRLLYVATTRARQFLHLMFELELDPDTETSVKPPPASSLLGHLWPVIDTQGLQQQAVQVLGTRQASTAPLAAAPLAAAPVSAAPAHPGGQKLWRMTLDSLPETDDAAGLAAGLATKMPSGKSAADIFSSVWQWQETEQHNDALIGTVAHLWLERLGRDAGRSGLASWSDVWSETRLRDSLTLIRRQLGRAGMATEHLEAASQTVLETLLATVNSERGRWLLHASQACREWSLLDASGRVSVIDLAIADEAGWLVVDYKTGVPHAGESVEHFSQRMRQRHGEQIAHYCAQVAALDGRPVRGALYFPRADIWLVV